MTILRPKTQSILRTQKTSKKNHKPIKEVLTARSKEGANVAYVPVNEWNHYCSQANGSEPNGSNEQILKEMFSYLKFKRYYEVNKDGRRRADYAMVFATINAWKAIFLVRIAVPFSIL